MLNLLLATAIAIWGIVVPTTIEPVYHDVGLPAYTTLYQDQCNIVIDMRAWEESQLPSVILHEYGHCLGLDHYGSCNHNLSIMGCPSLGYLSSYDRLMAGPKFTVIVGPWTYD